MKAGAKLFRKEVQYNDTLDDPCLCCNILENIGEGVITIDLKKRITMFNPAAEKITGFSQKEAIGQYCFDIFRANICTTKCIMEQSLKDGVRKQNVPADIINKKGDQIPLSISTSFLKDDKGDVIGIIEIFRDISELEKLRKQINRSFTSEDIVGKHPKMQEILSFLPDIAESDSPVLIEGPTGSGKELIARAIHSLSHRKRGPFIAVNCAALSCGPGEGGGTQRRRRGKRMAAAQWRKEGHGHR